MILSIFWFAKESEVYSFSLGRECTYIFKRLKTLCPWQEEPQLSRRWEPGFQIPFVYNWYLNSKCLVPKKPNLFFSPPGIALMPAIYEGRITRKTIFIHWYGKPSICPVDCTWVIMLIKTWRSWASYLFPDSLMLMHWSMSNDTVKFTPKPIVGCLHKRIILPR